MNKPSYDDLFFSKTREFLDVFLTEQCNRSPHTAKAYRDALTVFRRYLTTKDKSIKTFCFSDCTRDLMLGFMEYLQKEGYSQATCNHRLTAIKSYLWYVADGNISQQQTALSVSHVPQLRVSEKDKPIISEVCLKALISAPGTDLIGIRDTTIMVVLYDTALRLSELLSLKISDVNLQKDTPYLRIHGKGDKERIVALSDKTVPHLKRYIELFISRTITILSICFIPLFMAERIPCHPGTLSVSSTNTLIRLEIHIRSFRNRFTLICSEEPELQICISAV